MPGGKHEGLLQRLGFHDFNANANQAPHAAAVKFLKATGHSINSQTRGIHLQVLLQAILLTLSSFHFQRN